MKLYFRLDAGGIRRNSRLYVPYIMTCSLMVMMYYITDALSGDEMLRATVAYLRAHGMRPVSASVVVVANRPKIGKRRDEAQQALSHAIGCEVSLTATTTDGMGFTGSGEGIAAIANALVEPIG